MVRNIRFLQKLDQCFLTASGQSKVSVPALAGADDPGLVIDWQPHGLGSVEIRVLEGRQTQKAVLRLGRQSGLLEIQQIALDDLQLRRKVCHGEGCPPDLFPGLCVLLPLHQAAQGIPMGMEMELPLQFVRGNLLQGGQICPLVRVGFKRLIDKNRISLLSCQALQRQGDQIAEAALGQSVLIGKHPVVGGQLQTCPLLHGCGEQGAAQTPGADAGDRFREKEPQMRSRSAAGPFHPAGEAPFPAELPQLADTLLPVPVVKVQGQKTTAVLLKDRVNAHHIPA